MNVIKWMGITALLALLTVVAVYGSLGDLRAGTPYLSIVQSELERDGTGLRPVSEVPMLLPITEENPKPESVLLAAELSVTDNGNRTVKTSLSSREEMYTVKNARDHIVAVTNTGNTGGYIRTWFAFEMGELSEEEFRRAVLLNRNSTDWTWSELEWGVKIGDTKYAVVCAEYNEELNAGETTPPCLLQILLRSSVSRDVVNRLYGNGDGKYEILVHSQTVSDSGAFSRVGCPWK